LDLNFSDEGCFDGLIYRSVTTGIKKFPCIIPVDIHISNGACGPITADPAETNKAETDYQTAISSLDEKLFKRSDIITFNFYSTGLDVKRFVC